LDGDMACFPSDKYNLNGTGKSVFQRPKLRVSSRPSSGLLMR
jgi:hypothetical protein